jgi:hypothetical protein
MTMMIAQTALAQEPSEPVSSRDEMDRLPSKLDLFVKDAIDEGLLRPARPDEANKEKATDSAVTGESRSRAIDVADETPGSQAAPERGPAASAAYVCGDTSPFDFADFRDMAAYSDLDLWRRVVESEKEEGSDGTSLVMARAYLALGLAAEARDQLHGHTGQSARALRAIADLLDRRGHSDDLILRQVSECHANERFWPAIVMLKTNQPAGADLFEDQFLTFRRLPLRLRTELAIIASRALDRMNRYVTLEKLLASFTDDELRTSSQLQFARALFNLAVGAPGSETVMRDYFRSGRYRGEAGAALRRHGYELDDDFEGQLVASYMEGFEEFTEDVTVEESLEVVLQDLNDSIDYDMTLKLASMPAASSAEIHARLADHYEMLVDTDLGSADFLKNLQAMDGLLKAGELLASRPGLDTRFARASAIAADLGLKTMSEKLSARVDNDEALALAQAELAFHAGDQQRLWKLVQAQPQNTAIKKIAALDAIARGDRMAFGRLASGLPGDEQTALMMIEADAAAGHWIVPGSFHAVVEASDDETIKARAETVNIARPDEAPSSAASQIALADVSSRLSHLRQSLNSDPSEIR